MASESAGLAARASSRDAHWVARSLFSLSLTVEASPSKAVLRELDMWARTYIAGGLAYHAPAPPA